MSEADLHEADLSGADLSRVNLFEANLREANLREANLREVDLSGANLREANLSKAVLREADLSDANLESALLDDANFEAATVGSTIFGGVDLSSCRGLDSVRHYGPSTLGVDSIIHSKGRISEIFLRGVGLPDEWITYIPSLVGHGIQFFSCFISYSGMDKSFAFRLHEALQSKGIRCWLDEKQLLPGHDISAVSCSFVETAHSLTASLQKPLAIPFSLSNTLSATCRIAFLHAAELSA